MIDLGDTIPFAADVYNPSGVLANALTATLTITLPDGSTLTPTVTNPPAVTGKYGYDYPTTQAGPHDARWSFTFTGGLTTAHTEHYDVRPATLRSLISLADAKEQLNITTTTFDERLRGFLESATEVVERHTGSAVLRRTEVEDHKISCSPTLILNRSPVISVTSVARVDGSATWNSSSLYLSKQTGIVTVKSGALFSGHIEVTYVAGMLVIPRNYVDAAAMIIQHLWQTRRGQRGGPRPGAMEDTVAIPGMSFAIPRAALELLGPPPPLVA